MRGCRRISEIVQTPFAARLALLEKVAEAAESLSDAHNFAKRHWHDDTLNTLRIALRSLKEGR